MNCFALNSRSSNSTLMAMGARRIAWGLTIAGAGLAGCDEQKEAPPPPPPDVVVVQVQQRDVPIYRNWVGTLAGDVNATISAQVSGYLIARDYEEGRVVTK